MLILDILLTLLAAVLAVPIGLFALEVLLSLFGYARKPSAVTTAPSQLAILIPAHNESAVIARTLQTLLPTIPAGSRVLVVADNCTDETAAIARDLGAEAIERFDAKLRGKGFALDFGLQHLAQNPPAAVVFLDADCQVSPDTVRLLGDTAVATGRPVQGLNLCDPDPCGGVLQAVSGLAFRFKNLVRTLGLTRLAGMSYLTGTGMAMPWPLVKQAKLASGNVVEDMQLGIDLALAGHKPLFLPAARVDSPLPQQRGAAKTQRTRWEHGHLKTLLTQVPRLLGLALRHCRLDLAWLALDLAIPPLSLLVLTWATAWLVTLACWLCGTSPLPLLILTALGAILAGSVLIGWAAWCRQQVPLRALLVAPAYALWKLPIYAAFLLRRQRDWVRTQRDATTSPSP
ncbi:MAG: glycosyltransferase family 2 protein [Pirellulaceae bacterium]|nr:glycosyltransferase family 2 protein [Pirellulaceae bacterium]